MELINQFLSLLGLLGILILIIVGLGWKSFKVFCLRFSEEIAKNIAANVNLADQIRRIVATEEAKAITLRLDATKAEGAMKLQGFIAEIESILINCQLTAYFNRNELKEDETIEELGRRDLKKVSILIINLLKEANAYSVLLGDEILADIIKWVDHIHTLIFKYAAVYESSKDLNEGKSFDHNDIITTITNLLREEVYPTINKIGKIRLQIKNKISKKVHRTISEIVSP